MAGQHKRLARPDTLLRVVAAFAFTSLTGYVFVAGDARWHVNDDIGLLYFLSGALDGNPSWQVPFIAPIASIFLRSAYFAFGLRGYTIVLLAVLLIAIWLLIDATSKRAKKTNCFSLFYAILIALTALVAYFITIFNLTFTLVAGLSSAAIVGSLVLRMNDQLSPSTRFIILHAFILAFSISLRFNASALALIIMMPVWTHRTSARTIRVIVLTWTTTYLANKALSQFYSSDFKRWEEFDSIRGSLHGSRALNRVTPDLLENLNWTTNDFLLFRNFLHFDSHRFGLSQLRLLAEILDQNWVSRMQSVRFSDFQSASQVLQDVLVFSLMAGFAYFLWSGAHPARQTDYFIRLSLSAAIPFFLTAVLLDLRFPFRVELVLAFTSIISALILPLITLTLANPTAIPPSDGHGRGMRISTKIAIQRTGALFLLILAVVSVVNLHAGYFDKHVNFESPDSSRSQGRQAVLDILATREDAEVTVLMPGTEYHWYRSPFDSTALIPDRGIRFGWPIGSPAWERRNQALQIDLRQALMSAVNVHGDPVEISILSRGYPTLLSAYVQEESGVLPTFVKGPCAESWGNPPCLWYRSGAVVPATEGK